MRRLRRRRRVTRRRPISLSPYAAEVVMVRAVVGRAIVDVAFDSVVGAGAVVVVEGHGVVEGDDGWRAAAAGGG